MGDRDLATHLVRTQMLTAGYRLSEVTAALCVRWKPGVTLLPMSDDRIETHVVVQDDEGRRAIHFQEWWIRFGAGLPTQQFVCVGVESAAPAPGVLDAIEQADVVLFAPSNPVVSIDPILQVPGLREAVRSTAAPVVGVSPIIAGRAVRGMAEKCLAVVGVAADAAAVGAWYGARTASGVLDGWLVAEQDAALVGALAEAGITAQAAPLLMTDDEAAAALAAAALDLAERARA